MVRGQLALAVIVAGVIVACGSSGSRPSAAVPTPPEAVMGSASPTATAGANVELTDSPANPIPASMPMPSPSPTPVAEPPKPSGVSFAESRVGDDPPSVEITQTVTWDEPRNEGVEIRVYGVTECLGRPASPAPATSGPCLVEHTALPSSVRLLLATAPASDGAVSWTWTGTFDCEVGLAYDPSGLAYHAVVLAAYSTSDHSIFAIAEPGFWFEPGPNEIVC